MARRTYRERLQSALVAIVDPQAGAVFNAHDAVRADREAAKERRLVTLSLALMAGPSSWTSAAGAPTDGAGCHGVLGYAGDADLVARLASYVVDGLVAGDVCLVISTRQHRAGLRRRLAASGFADTEGLLVELDADELVSSFVIDGWPDAGLFDACVGDVLRSHLADGVGLRAFSEIVGLLVRRDEVPAALHVEKLWDALQLELGCPLLCGCAAAELDRLDVATAARVFARHTHLVSATA